MKLKLFLALSTVGALCGCGGSGGGTAGITPAAIAGAYSGTFTTQKNGASDSSGNAAIAVTSNGGVNITAFDTDAANVGDKITIVGTVISGGAFHGTFTSADGSTGTVTGTLSQPSANHLTFTFTGTNSGGGSTETGTIVTSTDSITPSSVAG